MGLQLLIKLVYSGKFLLPMFQYMWKTTSIIILLITFNKFKLVLLVNFLLFSKLSLYLVQTDFVKNETKKYFGKCLRRQIRIK
jgi:ABC-type transport system involved in cytochrome bd biosynthesis fused ATPase/permease subunit